ncbi:MAG: 2,3-bisphosphoglycerate-independent phosphoglycerate mutase [Clostridiales bacterium]|nr:2,3-bisphosphoglycerate-independent phosphoglycerate mutase [Clostridiales bacterium]
MVTLVIMDGLGINKSKHGNAVKLQGMPNLKKLKALFPHTELQASGEFVGLTKGQMGNSEVGHLNLGAGRVVYQDLPRIDRAIADKSFFENKALMGAVEHAKQNGSALHIMGLCSNGGVHSHINHLKALVDLANSYNLQKVYLHLFLDGRDTLVTSGVNFVGEIERHIKNTNVKIASLCGRVFAMDREKRYDRVQKAYDMLTKGIAEEPAKTIEDAFADSYGNKVYDEFFRPTITNDFEAIKDGDSVIFFNFRTDRAREITQAFTQKDFKEFKVVDFKNLYFATMTEYDATFNNVHIAFGPEKIEDNLSAIISKNGLKQFHISETTKYAHVTFFFNGGIEKPYKNEDRKLIESEDVLDFAITPKMKAFEITEEVLNAICSQKYDFILVNLSNADMIGHTGNLESAIEAIEAVDKCAYAIALATITAGGDCIITADHGNAEQMLGAKGEKLTAHTTNKVPFMLVSEKHEKAKLMKGGKLANVAPTVLQLLKIAIPENMERGLIK